MSKIRSQNTRVDMNNQFDKRVKCGVCGALISILLTLPLSEEYSKHKHDHLPETNGSTTTTSSLATYTVMGTDSTSTTTQPTFNNEYFS